MNAKHQASVGGKSSLPSGLATTQLRPGQVGTSAAVEVQCCSGKTDTGIIRFVADTEQTFYHRASTCRIVTKICF